MALTLAVWCALAFLVACTLPIWMLTELVRPRQRPVTNVVAVFVIVVTFVPLLLANRLANRAEGEGDVRR